MYYIQAKNVKFNKNASIRVINILLRLLKFKFEIISIFNRIGFNDRKMSQLFGLINKHQNNNIINLDFYRCDATEC